MDILHEERIHLVGFSFVRVYDDRIGKHSANGLRTNAQRTTANIPVGRIEELLFSGVVLLFFLPPKSQDD